VALKREPAEATPESRAPGRRLVLPQSTTRRQGSGGAAQGPVEDAQAPTFGNLTRKTIAESSGFPPTPNPPRSRRVFARDVTVNGVGEMAEVSSRFAVYDHWA
jgi:hypothetical protein